jgi:NADH dehydrogenase
MSTILVAGATGLLGSEICRQLSVAGKDVRGLVRSSSSPEKVSRLQSFGVETIQGDVRNRSSLDRACEGVTHVITTVSAVPFSYEPGVNDLQTTDLEGTTNLIEAAKARGVSQFIFTSISGNANIDSPIQRANREVERRLKESGLVYTILQPSFFMEVWLSPAVGFDAVNAKASISGKGENPISWIAIQDVAQFAVASLDHPAAQNATLKLGGPDAISPAQVVKIFEEASGRPFELQFVPEEALEAQQAAASDPMQQSFSALMRFYAAGDLIEMSDTLQTFPVQLTTLREYARRILTPA